MSIPQFINDMNQKDSKIKSYFSDPDALILSL